MAGRTWLDGDAASLVDEAPGAYKPLAQVMEDQADLVRPVHRLETVVNYKGVEATGRRRTRRSRGG
jgi:RNA-splicing ligase RtcB